MKFVGDHRWWTRAASRRNSSLDGVLLPLLGLTGLLAAFVFAAWRFEPAGGDFAAADVPETSAPADFHQLPAVRIALRADAAGRLAAISFNGHLVRDPAELRAQLEAFRGSAKDATLEAELDCDGKLRYEETQRTIAAISSCLAADGRTLVPLVDRIKFLPRGK
jgi:hypothetical protein